MTDNEPQNVEWEGAPPFVEDMAAEHGVSARNLWAVVKRQCITPNKAGLAATSEQVIVFLQRCKAHNLNPMMQEIYGYIDKDGKLVCGIEIDGFLKIANAHPAFDGLQVEMSEDEGGQLVSATATVWRKDREHPILITEYLAENRQDTWPWRTRPRRMLRHKAAREGIRYAFGVQALDPEEARLAAQGQPIALPEEPGTRTAAVEGILDAKLGVVAEAPEPDLTEEAEGLFKIRDEELPE